MSGKILLIVQTTASEEIIDISGQQPGIYLFDIRFAGHASAHYKVVKE